MGKRLIGIDLDAGILRLAILTQEKGSPDSLSLAERAYDNDEELAAALKELLGGELHYGNRFATVLPARDGFVRRLSFPFSDPKKITAALGFELTSQLPLAVETCITDFQQPVAGPENTFAVTAGAVRQETVAACLAPFDAGQIPLQYIDLAPFGYAMGLRHQVPDGVLICLKRQEATISLILEQRVVDYRILSLSPATIGESLAQTLLIECTALQKKADREDLPLYLIGSKVTPALQHRLQQTGQKVRIPAFPLEDDTVDPAFIPAVSLAYRADKAVKEKGFNFRSGPFAIKSQWGITRKNLIAAAAVLVLMVLSLAGSAYLNYASRAQRVESLQSEMVRAYKQTFPNSTAIVDIPLQLQGKVTELRKKLTLFGLDNQRTPLAALQQISAAMPADITVDIREFTYTEDGVRLEGQTSSFDAINRIAKSLEKGTAFTEIQISDAKMSLDGSRVDFRLNLTPARQGGAQ